MLVTSLRDSLQIALDTTISLPNPLFNTLVVVGTAQASRMSVAGQSLLPKGKLCGFLSQRWTYMEATAHAQAPVLQCTTPCGAIMGQFPAIVGQPASLLTQTMSCQWWLVGRFRLCFRPKLTSLHLPAKVKGSLRIFRQWTGTILGSQATLVAVHRTHAIPTLIRMAMMCPHWSLLSLFCAFVVGAATRCIGTNHKPSVRGWSEVARLRP